MCYLYWRHRPCQTDMFTEGYIMDSNGYHGWHAELVQ